LIPLASKGHGNENANEQVSDCCLKNFQAWFFLRFKTFFNRTFP
jgi:hypothetical protein